jgi:hypothetical protein
MAQRLLIAFSLMALCVTVHAWGMTAALRYIRSRLDAHDSFWRSTKLFVVIAVWVVSLHLIEISVWAVAFAWSHALPDLSSALYFSGVTYTTTGYGDVVLPKDWRLDGAVEALTGILMSGWSTGFFFTVVNRLHVLERHV